MIQKLDNWQLMECYEDVLKMGMEGLKDLELKHILQLKKYADHLYFEGAKFCINMTQAEIKILPEGITEENELQYFIDTSDSTQSPMYVLKTIEKYFEFKQIRGKAEKEDEEFRPKIIDDNAELKKKYKEISNPGKATFCLLIKNSGHYKDIGMSEFIINNHIVHRENYLKAICTYYNLTLTVRMYKADWSENPRPQYYQQIRDQIYPKIDKQTIDSIENYINSIKPHY